LLTNIVIAWNTARMQAVVERWRKAGTDVQDEWLRLCISSTSISVARSASLCSDMRRR
jgi:hypothetical protein